MGTELKNTKSMQTLIPLKQPFNNKVTLSKSQS